MRVAIDARELCGHPTGVGRYLKGLLDAWSRSEAARRHEWTLIAHQPVHDLGYPVNVASGNGGTVWEQFALPRAVRASRADVFFAPGYTAPLSVATPLVLTIHDVSYFAHPEWFSFREGTRRRLLTAWSARRARMVITDTQFSRSEIARHLGLSPSRLRVIPLGLSQPGTESTVEPVSANREAVVLYVGSIFERRRVDRLIASFDAVLARVPHARLEIVGENRTKRPRLDLAALRSKSAQPDRISIRSYVDDRTLAGLYQRASVFAFLSEYEGFGFTPLEALAAGVSPVLLDTAVARETCGAAARYVHATASNSELADVIAELLESTHARGELLQHAPEVLARYSWERAAEATLSVLEEAAVGR